MSKIKSALDEGLEACLELFDQNYFGNHNVQITELIKIQERFREAAEELVELETKLHERTITSGATIHQLNDKVADLEYHLKQSQHAVTDGLTNEVELTVGIRKAKVIIEDLLELIDNPPDADCSCHISPPCNDCVEYAKTREVIDNVNSFFSEGW